MKAQRHLKKDGRGRGNFTSRSLERPVLSRQLPPDQWPACDRKAWALACFTGGPLDDAGSAAHLAPATRKIREAAFGRLLSFLIQTGELVPDHSTETRLSNEVLARYIASMRDRMSAHSIRNSLHNLYLALRAMVPAHDFKWIRQHPDYPRERDAKAARKPVKSPNPVPLLAHAFRDAKNGTASKLTFQSALKVRNAVLMMVLMEHAIRLKNLAEMRVGQHLLFYENHIRLIFEDSVKNREVIDVVLTKPVAAFMRSYFEVQRPFLLRGEDDHGAVWVNLDGHPLQYSTMAQLIKNISTKWGNPMTPHGARYALATTTLTKDPRRIAVASAALAHRGTSSVNQVYDKSGSLAAQSCWQKLLQDISKP